MSDLATRNEINRQQMDEWEAEFTRATVPLTYDFAGYLRYVWGDQQRMSSMQLLTNIMQPRYEIWLTERNRQP